ncbi:hypothetical protein [Petropleomorpha daqingensis]|uniref:Putative membrane protein YhdT n=1 Tax=Petropleomorpha daqingensis TaxID=2026353 RepID=A0A853CGX4_9ACTN|nr:hypothetical protein [Petropleomorpha daqingensis]NYJ07060.1 putative membrane protein YhdT [Petropleomorpha daqingensis]
MIEGLAIAACVLLLLAAAFQLALGAGAPWAAAAYGGRAAQPDGRLPSRHRAASLATAVVLVAIGWLLLLRGGVVGTASENSALTVACWAFAALFAVNTLGNLAGRHPLERWGMGALTACLTVLCVLLALG